MVKFRSETGMTDDQWSKTVGGFSPAAQAPTPLQLKTEKFDSLSTQDQYNTLSELRKVGLIDKKKHQELIKVVGANAQAKIQEGNKPDLLHSVADTITDFTTRPIINASVNMGNAIASGVNFGINTLNGNNSKLQKSILESIAKENKIRVEFNKTHPMASLEAEQKAVAGQVNITRTLQRQQRGNQNDVMVNNDPSKVLGSALVLGGTVALPGAGKMGGIIGELGGSATQQAVGRVAGNVLEGMTAGSLLGSANQSANTGFKTTPGENVQAALGGMAVGGTLSGIAGGISEVFKAKASSRLADIKAKNATAEMLPSLTDQQVKDFTPQEIKVQGTSKAEKVGVKTPQVMSDTEYTARFNKLSDSYDKATTQLAKESETMPLTQQRVMARLIDEQHMAKLNALDEEFNNPKMSVQGKNKVASKSTPQVTKTGEVGITTETGATNPELPTVQPKSKNQAVTGSAIRTQESAVEAQLAESLPDKAKYNVDSYKAAASKAVKVANGDRQAAMDIVEGKVSSTPVERVATARALENKAIAEGDVATIKQLAHSKSNTAISEAAQTLGSQGYNVDRYSPVEAIKKIEQTREKNLIRRYGNKKISDLQKEGIKVTDQETKAILDMSNEIKKTAELPGRSTELQAMDKKWIPNAQDKAYGLAQYKMTKFVSDLTNAENKLKLSDLKGRGIITVPAHLGRMLLDATKSIGASLDDSFIGRQGQKAFWTNNRLWRQESLKTFSNFVKGFKSADEAHQAIISNLMADPWYERALNDGVALAKRDDVFPTSLPGKAPLIGRAFNASEAAYDGMAQSLRLKLYKANMKPVMDMVEAGAEIPANIGKNMAKLSNSLSGRGTFGKFEPAAGHFNIAFYSLRFLKSNFDTLLYHPLGGGIGGTADALMGREGASMMGMAQKKAITNLAKIVGGTASIMGLAGALEPGSTTFDPRSSDFGKIRVGDTTFDLTGGMGSLIVLVAKVATQTSISPVTGKVTALNSGDYGSQTTMDVIQNFLRGKLSPVGGVVATHLIGTDFNGQKPTLGGDLTNLFTPLMYKNYQELQNDPNSANIVLSMIVDGLGISTNTYQPSGSSAGTGWSTSTSKTIQQFQDKVGQDKFAEAGKKFDDKYNAWISSVRDTATYKALSDTDKATVIQKEKDKIQSDIFKSYNFKYKQEKTNPHRFDNLIK